MARSINPHLSPGFHPKVGQVLELCNRHEQWKPQKKKKHSILSQTTRNEVLCMLMGNQRSPPFPLRFFLNLLALPEASLSLKMAMLGQQQ